jgi:hypothetical protein
VSPRRKAPAAEARERGVIAEAATAFDVSPAAVVDLTKRDQDAMDARAVAAFRLVKVHGYGRMRAARALGYQGGSQALCQAFARLALRVYQTPRLAKHVGLTPVKEAA